MKNTQFFSSFNPWWVGIDKMEYDAFIDCEKIYTYPIDKLFSYYPNAKYILTYRNPSEQALSYVKLCYRWRASYVNKVTPYTYEEFFNRLIAHYSKVFEFFYDKQESFYVHEVGKGWSGLCEFLGKEQPNIEYPWVTG